MRAMFVVLLCVLPASAQSPRGSVVQTEIYNGLSRTVRYSGVGLTSTEAQYMREMERLENELSYVRELGEVKRSYVASERQLEPQRRAAEMAALATDYTISTPYPFANLYGAVGYPLGFTSRAYGLGLGMGFGFGNGNFASFSMPAAGYAGAGAGFGIAADEGSMKTSLAKYIASQSSTDYAAVVDRSLEQAKVRASSSPSLRAALDLPAGRRMLPESGRRGEIRPASDDPANASAPVVLTLKGGEVVRGVKLEEKGAWLIVTLANKRTMRLREVEVARIETGPVPGGIKPSVDD